MSELPYLSPMGGEPAIVVGDRKELTYLLCQGAELEHALMCEYLYAAFSLKTTPDPGLPGGQLETVERWRGVLLAIAGITQRLWGDLPAEDLATAGRVLAIITDRANAELARAREDS